MVNTIGHCAVFLTYDSSEQAGKEIENTKAQRNAFSHSVALSLQTITKNGPFLENSTKNMIFAKLWIGSITEGILSYGC